MDVKAFLDGYGMLQVHEEFTLELDGNWEVLDRRFPSSSASQQYEQRYPGQAWRLSVRRFAVFDERSESEFDLEFAERPSAEPRFYWEKGDVLYWRVRRPTDPPFHATRISYVLEYELMHTITDHGPLADYYRGRTFTHDFLPFHRRGVIDHFAMNFSVEPFWKTPDFPNHISREAVQPGDTVTIELPLQISGVSAADPRTNHPVFTEAKAQPKPPPRARPPVSRAPLPGHADTVDETWFWQSCSVVAWVVFAVLLLALLILWRRRKRA